MLPFTCQNIVSKIVSPQSFLNPKLLQAFCLYNTDIELILYLIFLLFSIEQKPYQKIFFQIQKQVTGTFRKRYRLFPLWN